MDIYKDFIEHLRRLSYDEVYILLRNITPKLTEYVRLLTEVKFQDGLYHTFYGDVKIIISNFVNYFNQTVDEVLKEADKYSNVITKDNLMELIEQTISTYQSNQVEFANVFLPNSSPSEKLVYEEIEGRYNDHMKKLYELRGQCDQIKKPEKIIEFAKDHFEIVVKKTSEIFNFTYVYLALMLADCLNKTRTSIEEIILRLSNNLKRVHNEREVSLNRLLDQLYDKNKEALQVNRADRRCSVLMAVVRRDIESIKNKLKNFETEVPQSHLEEEVSYWQKRLKDFNEVAANLVKLKTEQENVTEQARIYNSMRTTELPGGDKHQCWINIGENYAEQKVFLKKLLTEEAKAMVTFFACRGSDRILYTNKTGPYYVDEFNHLVYVLDNGMGIYHVNCEGEFRQPHENLYYFDKYGRYINQDGKKFYQCAPCTSLYELEDNNLLTKVSQEAKITMTPVPGDTVPVTAKDLQCNTDIKVPEVAMLPDIEPIDIKSTLDKETVKYLWESFGNILPDALFDVGMANSMNPIHFLAHKLLFHKYKRTLRELHLKKAEAEEFRAKLIKERKEEAIARSKAWKSKQVKRCKPEESDDMQERAVYDAQMAQQDFINSLNFYTFY